MPGPRASLTATADMSPPHGVLTGFPWFLEEAVGVESTGSDLRDGLCVLSQQGPVLLGVSIALAFTAEGMP